MERALGLRFSLIDPVTSEPRKVLIFRQKPSNIAIELTPVSQPGLSPVTETRIPVRYYITNAKAEDNTRGCTHLNENCLCK